MILLIYLITTFGLIGFFIWLLIDLLVLHQERGERLAGWLAKLVAWTGRTAEKTATAMSVQGKVNSFIASINTEVEGLLPYSLKIKWISPEINEQAFIEKNRVVVLLSHHQNQDENLSKATMLYMNKAVIPEARPHIHFKLCDAIDLTMTKKALYSFIEARSVFDYFVTKILRPRTEEDNEMKNFCTVIDALDECGLFTRVLLRELKELGYRRAGITETGDTVFETAEFTKFLAQIARKERGENVPLTFSRNYIKVSIILIAREETEFLGTDPFMVRIKDRIKTGISVIYIFARGSNISLTKKVCQLCKQIPELTEIHKGEEFPTKIGNKTISGYCSIFYNRKTI
jgi:small subunit ribosomal protein S1